MNTKYLLLILQIFCLISFISSMASAGPSDKSDGCQDPLLAATSDEKKVVTDGSGNLTMIDEDTQEQADNLGGTCPKGFHCSCPGCPLYSDLDEDKFCDLGEETDDTT